MASGKYIINYFPYPRGKVFPLRVALEVAGLPYEYNAIKREDWLANKADTDKFPFGTMPAATLPDGQHVSETIAILYHIGMSSNLMYKDPVKDAQIMMMILAVDDCVAGLVPSLQEKDDAKKKQMREAWMSGKFKSVAEGVDRQLAKTTTYAVGDKMTIADIYIHFFLSMPASDFIDHIPKDLFAPYKNISRVVNKVNEHPKVKEFMAKLC